MLVALPLAGVCQDARATKAGQKTVAALQKKVAAGDTKAMKSLSYCYEAGYGVPVDTARAVELMRKAMEAGDADAKAGMAFFYLWYSGLGYDSAMVFRLAREVWNEETPAKEGCRCRLGRWFGPDGLLLSGWCRRATQLYQGTRAARGCCCQRIEFGYCCDGACLFLWRRQRRL